MDRTSYRNYVPELLNKFLCRNFIKYIFLIFFIIPDVVSSEQITVNDDIPVRYSTKNLQTVKGIVLFFLIYFIFFSTQQDKTQKTV